MWIPLTVAASLAAAPAVEATVARTAAHRSLRRATDVPELPPSAYDNAASGGIATGVFAHPTSGRTVTWAVAVLDAPIDAVWQVVNGEVGYPDPRLEHIELTRGRRCEDGRYVLSVAPASVLGRTFTVTRVRTNDALSRASEGAMRELVWSSVERPAQEPMSDAARALVSRASAIPQRGSWLLVAVSGSRTLVEHHSWVDVGLPAWMIAHVARLQIRKSVRRVAAFADAPREGVCAPRGRAP